MKTLVKLGLRDENGFKIYLNPPHVIVVHCWDGEVVFDNPDSDGETRRINISEVLMTNGRSYKVRGTPSEVAVMLQNAD